MRKVFYNGNIVTMNSGFVCNAMAVDNDIIVWVGEGENMPAFCDCCEKVDLKGKTVLPAFIDAHSHIMAVANTFLQTDLSKAENEEDVRLIIEERGKENIVRAYNMSNGIMLDNSFIDSFDFPLVIQHNSGHSGFFNKRAQKEFDIKGYFLQENEYFESIKKLPIPSMDEITRAFKKAENIYFSKGITFAQEGVLMEEMVPMYRELIKRNELDIDITAYKNIDVGKVPESSNFHIGGYKIFLDGSPQARTAWISRPYENSDECGVSTMTYDEADYAVKKAVSENMQIIAHCNGDRAIDRFIEVIDNNRDICPLRPVVIHGQLMRKDQMAKMRELNIIPSFFAAHIYYYGDVHIKNLGERAYRISPLKSAVRAGLYPTVHQDSPVIMPDMFESVWCQVKRVTKNGVVLGEDERISVYEAIESV